MFKLYSSHIANQGSSHHYPIETVWVEYEWEEEDEGEKIYELGNTGPVTGFRANILSLSGLLEMINLQSSDPTRNDS
jgi:hypothetical protein